LVHAGINEKKQMIGGSYLGGYGGGFLPIGGISSSPGSTISGTTETFVASDGSGVFNLAHAPSSSLFVLANYNNTPVSPANFAVVGSQITFVNFSIDVDDVFTVSYFYTS
jgi:hypothetical protein